MKVTLGGTTPRSAQDIVVLRTSMWYSHSSVALSDQVSFASLVEVARASRPVGRAGAADALVATVRNAKAKAPQRRVLCADMGVDLLGRRPVESRCTKRGIAPGGAGGFGSWRGAPVALAWGRVHDGCHGDAKRATHWRRGRVAAP